MDHPTQQQQQQPRSSVDTNNSDHHDGLPELDPLSRRFTSVEVLTRNAPAGKISLPRHVHLRQGNKDHSHVTLRPLFGWGAPPTKFFPSDTQQSNDSDSGFCDPPQPYHVFSKQKKLRLAYLVSLAAVFSPLSSNIYFPALNTIAAVS
jgi:hypothetical protein